MLSSIYRYYYPDNIGKIFSTFLWMIWAIYRDIIDNIPIRNPKIFIYMVFVKTILLLQHLNHHITYVFVKILKYLYIYMVLFWILFARNKFSHEMSSNYGYTHNQPFPYPSYLIPVGMESSDSWKESETQSSNDFFF